MRVAVLLAVVASCVHGYPMVRVFMLPIVFPILRDVEGIIFKCICLVITCCNLWWQKVPATFEDLSETSKDFDQEMTTRNLIPSVSDLNKIGFAVYGRFINIVEVGHPGKNAFWLIYRIDENIMGRMYQWSARCEVGWLRYIYQEEVLSMPNSHNLTDQTSSYNSSIRRSISNKCGHSALRLWLTPDPIPAEYTLYRYEPTRLLRWHNVFSLTGLPRFRRMKWLSFEGTSFAHLLHHHHVDAQTWNN